MEKRNPASVFLGLDVGRVNTRASLFNIVDGKYHLGGCVIARSSLGQGLHLGEGVGEAVRNLQHKLGYRILKPGGGLLASADGINHGLDQVAISSSAGPMVKTVLLGVTKKGSLAAGRMLIESLPMVLTGEFGMADLMDPPEIVDTLVNLRPEVLIITGGEDGGIVEPVRQWIEIARLICHLLPTSAKPPVFFMGNPSLQSYANRRLEPVTNLQNLPNLQPISGVFDLVPAQACLDQAVVKIWEQKLAGFSELTALSHNNKATKAFAMGRMVRYLCQLKNTHAKKDKKAGVLAIDLGAGSSVITAGFGVNAGNMFSLDWEDANKISKEPYADQVQQWVSASISSDEIRQYLANQAVVPAMVPQNLGELALSQAIARVQMRNLLERFSEKYPWLNYDQEMGLRGHYEPVIASGSVITQAPTPGQSMLMLLDGLQPWGVTTMVLDPHHILSLLGVIGEITSVLPVQIMSSEAFKNLGTVVTAVSQARQGEEILMVNVSSDAGKDYSVAILQGTLRRIIIPAGTVAVLDLQPAAHTDIGFGGEGIGGKLKLTGGLLGVVIDARGRPLKLASDDDERTAELSQWLSVLGG